MISPDPQLSEHAPAVERALAQAARQLGPEEFGGLIGDPGLSVLRSAMDSVGADSMSVWLSDADQANLVVTHSEPNREFVGWKQPLGEGITSLAYVSEQSLCENRVYLNEDHSKRADEALGQVTYALIVTPFYIAGTLRGVVSCVQLKESPDAPDPAGFSARHMNRVRRLGTALERLVNYRLITTFLSLEL